MSEQKSVQLRWQAAKDTEPGREGAVLGERRGNRFWIVFNRPRRFNAFTNAMYDIYKDLIAVANEDPEVKFIVVTGNGGTFSSGNDLSNFTNPHYMGIAEMRQMSEVAAEHLRQFSSAIINSRKPIFALVEGKIIGFAFTQLALYDRVFAVDGAQFNAPLVQLAQGPEMCASVTFPPIFGRALTEDLLVKGVKVDASFLAKHGFLTSYSNRKEAERALEQHLGDLEQL
jgi:enoyl-CoA hydratase/carnithine racemase